MGLLDILSSIQGGGAQPGPTSASEGKGMSPIAKAMLALLAVYALKHTSGWRAVTAEPAIRRQHHRWRQRTAVVLVAVVLAAVGLYWAACSRWRGLGGGAAGAPEAGGGGFDRCAALVLSDAAAERR